MKKIVLRPKIHLKTIQTLFDSLSLPPFFSTDFGVKISTTKLARRRLFDRGKNEKMRGEKKGKEMKQCVQSKFSYL